MKRAAEPDLAQTPGSPQRARRAELGFRSKLFLASLAVIGMATIAGEFFLTRALEGQLIEGIRADLLVRARLAALRAADAWRDADSMRVQDALADEMGRAAGARVTLVRRDGVVVGDSEIATDRLAALDNHGTRPEIQQALAGASGYDMRWSQSIQMRLMYAAVPVLRAGEVVGTARVALPLQDVDQTLRQFQASLALAALAALLVAALLSWLAAQLVSRNVRALTAAARRMANGDLALRARVAGSDEIAQLGGTLDQLAHNLSRSLGELRSERDLLNGILAGMAEGVLLVGQDGRILLVNPALKAMLLIAGDPQGKYVLHVIRNADLNELINRARGGEAPPMELELAGLVRRRVLVRAVALQDAPDSVLAVLVDVTELRRLESVRRDFVANASHELRSPLTTIRAAAETLASVPDDPEGSRRFIELIGRSAQRLQNLVDDMLELSRIESRELQLQPEVIELGPLAERIVAQQAHRAQLQSIAITREFGAVPPVRADRRALEHVLGNLLDNAVKYCPEGAHVSLRAEREDDRIRIAVTDDGPGIAEEHQARLFERFYRVDPGRSREMGGTGLGLAIVKHLVEAMGGTVRVDSRPGAGSTFSFTLPLGI